MKNPFVAAMTLLIVHPIQVAAQETSEVIDEIVVAGRSVSARAVEVNVEQKMIVDSATALKELPGANVNKNGSITGIAQYRGMYGDRVAVSIDDHMIVSGGPNAMDARLSYTSPMITEALVVDRGIAAVSSAPESIGGHIKARVARGEFGGDQFGISGFAGSRFSDNGDVSTSAGRLTFSNQSHRFSVVAEMDRGDNFKTPQGEVIPSMLERDRYDLSYAFTDGSNHLVVFAGKLDTSDSGSPALPMDIRSIDTDLAGAHFRFAVSPAFSLEGKFSVNDVDHVMDNFALRSAPMPMAYRQNHAIGNGQTFTLAGDMAIHASSIRIGINGIRADHDSLITNPNNAAFGILNFNHVQRDLLGAFAEWVLDKGLYGVELGLSFKQVQTNAGDVAVSGMSSPGPGMLANAFNASKRDIDFDDVDLVAKYSYRPSDRLEWQFGVAQKSRAPSYQELYLWLPLQATGGLADGRSYIGDLELQSERSRELNLGLFFSSGPFSISPQVFYKRIDDYIQGVPSTNSTANMISMMMTGKPALQFANTDAEIFGLDLAWAMVLSENWKLDGIASYARGKRTDIADNLYRLAPPNGNIGLTYGTESWSIETRVVAYASQHDVAAFNDELLTPGYELVNVGFTWNPSQSLSLELRADNLFDSGYQDHLAGINRAGGSDMPVGERLYGQGRALRAGVIFGF